MNNTENTGIADLEHECIGDCRVVDLFTGVVCYERVATLGDLPDAPSDVGQPYNRCARFAGLSTAYHLNSSLSGRHVSAFRCSTSIYCRNTDTKSYPFRGR